MTNIEERHIEALTEAVEKLTAALEDANYLERTRQGNA